MYLLLESHSGWPYSQKAAKLQKTNETWPWFSGWWFGTWMDYDFPYIGNVIIPTDELIFFRGVGIPPTSFYLKSTHLKTTYFVKSRPFSHVQPRYDLLPCRRGHYHREVGWWLAFSWLMTRNPIYQWGASSRKIVLRTRHIKTSGRAVDTLQMFQWLNIWKAQLKRGWCENCQGIQNVCYGDKLDSLWAQAST